MEELCTSVCGCDVAPLITHCSRVHCESPSVIRHTPTHTYRNQLGSNMLSHKQTSSDLCAWMFFHSRDPLLDSLLPAARWDQLISIIPVDECRFFFFYPSPFAAVGVARTCTRVCLSDMNMDVLQKDNKIDCSVVLHAYTISFLSRIVRKGRTG